VARGRSEEAASVDAHAVADVADLERAEHPPVEHAGGRGHLIASRPLRLQAHQGTGQGGRIMFFHEGPPGQRVDLLARVELGQQPVAIGTRGCIGILRQLQRGGDQFRRLAGGHLQLPQPESK
jgi:hypothetical protein